MVLTADSATLTVSATTVILGTTFTVVGFAAIYSDDDAGIAGVLELSASVGFLSDYGVTLSGSYLFEINTTGINRDFTYTDSNDVGQIRTVSAGVKVVM